MHLTAFSVRNFRRLKDVTVDLDKATSIFVGSNNSGKTSAAKIFDAFLSPIRKTRFSLFDFSASCWPIFDEIGDAPGPTGHSLPTIALDLWFHIQEDDLYRVVDLLPHFAWKDVPVGVRLEYAPKNEQDLLSRYREAKALATKHAKEKGDGKEQFHPWPKSLSEYLKKELTAEYKISYFALDYAQFDSSRRQAQGYTPKVLGDSTKSGATILRSILRVDFLDAQRFQSDEEITASENLSSRLSRFYDRNLEKFSEDFTAIAALVDSEDALNEHFKLVFGDTLEQLNKLGYPGFANPDLVIRSAFDPESILTKSASVHYALRDPGKESADTTPPMLPDKYNGLGFKNLIYMVVEIMDFHHQWTAEKEERPPIHLIVIEEPESHLHAQLQQVFVNKILEVIPKESNDFSTQMILTTHSPHVIYESNFTPIRYFRRLPSEHYSEVLNLSKFYESQPNTRDFLLRYTKLAHCDLFFADAAILVEGNVERILLPHLIAKVAPELTSAYLTILEVGGAFAHKFRELVHFLGLTTLVITDIDSVHAKQNTQQNPEVLVGAEDKAIVEDEEDDSDSSGGCCMTSQPQCVTSNQTLKEWIPKLMVVQELLDAQDDKKCPTPSKDSPAKVRVTYQTREPVTWGTETATLAGRTFEEEFAFRNLALTQDPAQKPLGLRVQRKKPLSLAEMIERIHDRVKNSNFKKTDFALGVIQLDPLQWQVPPYIVQGLRWLSGEVIPLKLKGEEQTTGQK